MKIRGNTVGTPMPIPDWNQDNPLRANYIKNKPEDRLLPAVTEEDNDKLLLVKDGKWVSDNVPNLGGKDGEDGKDGKDGADGKDGEDGVGIASVEQTVVSTADGGTNIVTVTLTNGASYDFAFMNGRTGPQGPQGIQGIPGEDGKGFSISKIYASIIDMMNGYATDGVEVGGFVLINTGNVEDADNAKLFVKTETAYSYLSDLSGSQGIQGPEGRQGIQGPVGNTGVGIHYIYQSQTTSADGGKNVVTIMLTNGTEYSCTFYNGSKGSDGKDGAAGAAGVGISKVEQTTTSTADGGNNVVTVTLTNGNTSTFTVKNGTKGSDGKDGTNGKDGKDGNDGTPGANGTSVFVTNISESSESGGTNVVSFSDGKKLEVRNGSKGKDGTSYMSPPIFANNISECTDTSKLYVLPDGYIYGYITVSEITKAYTNLAKNITVGRFNSSGNVDATTTVARTCTDWIPLDKGTVRVKGFGALTDYNTCVYTKINTSPYSGSKANAQLNLFSYSYDSTSGIVSINQVKSELTYIRFSGIPTGADEDIVITVNEEIKDTVVTTQKWANTGHAFVPADYEDRIIDLEDDVIELKNEMASGGSSPTSPVVTVPSYWESMIETKTEIVKALQTEGGLNAVSFAYASDTHIPDNDNGRTNDIGKVMAKMLDNCEIPFAVIAGDVATRASYSTEAEYVIMQSQVKEHLAPLWGTDRLLITLGNHDGCYGDSSGHYRKQFSPERMWQSYFRSHALDFKKVFSDDGLYYYVDNIPQKTRFIVLNSNYGGNYSVDSNGWAVNNRFGTSCYGQAQLDWLSDTALDMPEGFGALIFTHVPFNVTYTVDKTQLIGIINAYNGKTNFTGSYTGGVNGWSNSSVNVNFSDAKGEIIAVVAGHVHGDSVDTASASCPVITILSAGASANDPYKETAPTRTKGTDTETSFDIVTVNKKTRTIYCTRVGAGSDRSVTY